MMWKASTGRLWTKTEINLYAQEGPAMQRIGYDSDVIDDIPADAEVALTYSDLVPTRAELIKLEQRWPVVVLIDRGTGDPTGLASVLDVERGAATVAQAPGWYDERVKAGIRWPTIYVNRANMAAVNAAMAGRMFYRWIATLDGTMRVAEHPAAMVQFAPASAAGQPGTGWHADATVIRQSGWHPAPGPNVAKLRSALEAARAELAQAFSHI